GDNVLGAAALQNGLGCGNRKNLVVGDDVAVFHEVLSCLSPRLAAPIAIGNAGRLIGGCDRTRRPVQYRYGTAGARRRLQARALTIRLQLVGYVSRPPDSEG